MKPNAAKILILTVITILAAATLWLAPTPPPAGAWTYENPLPTGSNLFSVSALDDDDVWASGNEGAIIYYDGASWADRSIPNIYSSNVDICALDATHVWMSAGARGIYFWNGSEWKLQKKGIYLTFSPIGLDVLNASHGWAVGTSGGILRWDGISWTEQASGTTEWLFEVSAVSANDAWAVGTNGTILHWDGTSWTPKASGTTKELRGVCATAANNAWAVGAEGTILHWDGTSWSPQAGGSSNWFFSVDALDATHAWAVGHSGAILYWNGAAWAPQGSGTTQTLHGISAVDANHAWAVGIKGTILHYDTGTWSSGSRGPTDNLYGTHALDAHSAWAVGQNGTIMVWNGIAWSAEASGTAAELRSVYARAPGEIFAVGASGTILFDDGTGWAPQASGTTDVLLGVTSPDATHAWAVGQDGTILFDDGTGWAPQASGITTWLYGTYALDATHAWAVGQDGVILFYDGSGWAPQASGTTEWLYGVCALDATHAWAVGANGTILFWNGTAWAPQDSGIEDGRNLYSVSALDANHAWAVGDDGLMLYYNGLAWSEQPTGVPGFLWGVHAQDANHVWAVGDYGTIISGAAPAPTEWYLAEGCTEGGMETYVLVQNPNPVDVTVDLTLMTPTGEEKPAGLQDRGIPAGTRCTFRLNDYLTGWEVSTRVTPTGGEVICERAMYGNNRTWAHDSIGATTPADEWYLAEGCTQGGMETFILVQNPGTNPVSVDMTLQTAGGEVKPPLLQGVTIPAGNRCTFKLNDYAVAWDVSTRVSSLGGEVICERAMYGNSRTWAHDSIGATAPAPAWYLAEGCTEGGMETYVLVQNPGAAAVMVDLTLQTSTGEDKPAGLQGQQVAAGSRRTFKLNDYLTDWNVSTLVEATGGEVICERAMYGGGWTWGHDSIGVTAPAPAWYLAEGCTEGGMETYVLVQNPGAAAVTVDLTLMTGSGEKKPHGLQGVTVPAGSRSTFKLNDYLTDWNVSTLVEATGGEVICERAMYGNGWTWGHDSVGYTPH